MRSLGHPKGLLRPRSGRSPIRHQNGTEPLPTPRKGAAKLAPLAISGGEEFVKRFIALAAVCLAAVFVAGAGARSSGLTLKGAGSTFVSPLILTWVQPYEAATGVHIDYNPIGSGGGIQAIQNRQVDFGASDAPLTPDQFNGCNGCVQVPITASGTSISYNLQGAPPHLKITGTVLANIYLGKIKKWNDAALKKLNPGVNLPDVDITPIFRSDGSGTTYNFTDYLSKVSPEWKSKVGNSTQVNFPTGVGGRGSSGVSAVLSRTNGGIIYVDVAFATKNHFSFFAVKNKAGKYQLPGSKQIKAAMDTVTRVNPDNKISIVDPPKSASLAYPICTFVYVILPLKSDNATALRKFVFWGMTSGAKKYGPPLRFLQIPPKVLSAANKTLKKVQG
jgi:phosphate transport system substrate-binding protein